MIYKRAVHIHIPKTAGTSVTRYMQNLFGNANVAHFGRRDKTALFRKLQAEDLKQYRCIGGHLTYPVLLEKIGPDALYFTILRDPFDLYMSYYCDVKHRESHPLHGKANQLTHFSFLEYVAANNLLKSQTSYLSIENSLSQAIALIDKKKVFAETLPYLGEFLEGIAEKFDKRPVALPHRNSSKRNDISDSAVLRDAVENYFASDMKLIAYIDNNRISQATAD